MAITIEELPLDSINSHDKMFFIEWENGQPFLISGLVVEVGKKRKQHRVEYRGLMKYRSQCEQTPKDAIERAILDVARWCGGCEWFTINRKKAKPWLMANAIRKLVRLAARLGVKR